MICALAIIKRNVFDDCFTSIGAFVLEKCSILQIVYIKATRKKGKTTTTTVGYFRVCVICLLLLLQLENENLDTKKQ